MPQRNAPNWKEHFPIFQSDDYDVSFPDLPYSIGVKSTFPEELVRRILAAALSFQLRNKSIDYTYKRYVSDVTYDTGDVSRLDIRIADTIESWCSDFRNLVHHISASEPKLLGNIISEWTLMRAPHSIRQLTSLAQRGNLYESCAVARMILEQLAWSLAIDGLDDAKAISRIKAESSIQVLKRKVSFAGSLYGWLSAHTHWRYDGHIKAMSFSHEGMATLLQSSRFKAISLLVALLLMITAMSVLRTLRTNAILEILAMDPDARLQAGKRLGEEPSFLQQLLGSRGPSAAQIRSHIELTACFSLIDEIGQAGVGDKDVGHLWQSAADFRKTFAAD